MSSKKDKGGKGKVEPVAEVAAVSGDANKVIELESQVKELKVALRKAEETLAARDHEMEMMRAETASSREKVADALRNSARRIAQVALLEATLEEQRRKEEMLEVELHKHSQMMDSVMNYRDKETSREYHEILRESTQRRLIEPGQCACVRTCARPCLHTERLLTCVWPRRSSSLRALADAELSEKCARWKQRAEMLQQERWEFVRKWKKERVEAIESNMEAADLKLNQKLNKALDSDGEEREDTDEEVAEEHTEDAGADDDGW
jgi:hypothetical protein